MPTNISVPLTTRDKTSNVVPNPVLTGDQLVPLFVDLNTPALVPAKTVVPLIAIAPT